MCNALPRLAALFFHAQQAPARVEADGEAETGDELQHFLGHVARQPRNAAERLLEDLRQPEDDRAGDEHAARRFHQGPADGGHEVPPAAERVECEDHGRKRHDEQRQRAPAEPHARVDEKARVDDLAAEDQPVEIDLADDESGQHGGDEHLEHR